MEAAREANRKIYQAGGTIHDMETRTKTKSGKIVPVRVSASHLYDSYGKYIGGVGYFAKYRPWAGAEADVKARVEDLETKLEKWKAMTAPVFELYPGLSVMVLIGNIISERFEDIVNNLLDHVERVKTRVVLLDLSGAVVDGAEVAKKLARMVRTVRLLGADCIIADMHSTLARAMEPLMAELGSLKSYISMEIALEEALKTLGYEICRKA
jgi:anti-anti-sigma regulatory factor